MFLLLLTAFATEPGMTAAQLEQAKAAAAASIAEGERHQLRSKYWQTFRTRTFQAVVPSYAEPVLAETEAGSTWTLDLAGDYELVVLHPKVDDASTVVNGWLARFAGGNARAEDTPTGRVLHVTNAPRHALVGYHADPLVLVEVSAPAGSFDPAIAQRVWNGFQLCAGVEAAGRSAACRPIPGARPL